MRAGDRGGFTLVELLIVAVLGVIVVGATYQMILTSQRAYTTQTAQLQGQQTVRAGIDILFAELRELSGVEGDILEMNPDRIEIRAMRAFGLVCNVNPTGSPIRVKKIGRYFESGDSIVVFADNDPNVASDDTILSGAVASITPGETCTGTDTAQSLVVPDLVTALANDTVRLGAPVRGFTIYTYGLYTLDGVRRNYGAPGGATLRERGLVHLHGLWRDRHCEPQGGLSDRGDTSVHVEGHKREGSRRGLPYNYDLSAELTNDADRSDRGSLRWNRESSADLPFPLRCLPSWSWA